ncbi:baseplate multidomain protein megatron [Pararhizobium haloflavum]|uniref:baseplate multidomain protein megatron n=1 Tax=Pararhizobium haloflavum TaxID=2037914 RepID=UPI000C17A2A8|nr:glycoside hydrolase/phage tail family protein [Pararhizobium haloflavum]
MATILLQAAGAALGSIFGPLGAVAGRAAGALAGSAIDRSLVGGGTVRGPRLEGGRIPTSDEGAGILRLYGTARIAGNLIWATRFEEEVTSERQGGKVSGGARVETHNYYANFAIGLCEGPVAAIRRVWADGREIDLTEIEFRLHRGSEDQSPDPLIEAKQGEGHAPAYRGLAYVVFERLPLDRFGNRIPVLHFEVTRPVGLLERELRAITIIPGASEHGYAPHPVSETVAAGESRILNRHVTLAETDWTASIDELQALCPNLQSVALICAWFGDDLRAGQCRLRPGVEVRERLDESVPWTVSGLTRQDAHLMSRRNDAPAFGGTPNDAAVLAAIADLKARGLKVFLYPFIMMDIPAGNAKPDPEGAQEQPVYPWRGRITSHPAIGRPASADQTADAMAQVEAFCGAAEAADFAVGDGAIAYHGGDTGFRRFVLHYAHLATLAGGVDGFVLASEMRGLTRVRDDAGGFPFVDQMARLAADLRTVLGDTTGITYAADWSEYFGYRPDDGSDDLFFNLDPLWAHPAITAVGIDNYMPLADWRDDDLVNGNPDGFATPTDRTAMANQIAAGEGFDWYYASDDDRRLRQRTPITDGAAGKPWVFRFKDMESWWSNAHHERSGGVEHDTPTAWVPGAKPIWFTELGCPAVDKGANQPNVFPDPKSSESGYPHFSNGTRSDLVQRRFLEAHLQYWTKGQAPAGMVDPQCIFAWTWDARPYPAFPEKRHVWSDGDNWATGHWLTGRLGSASAADMIAAILQDHGFALFQVDDLGADIMGYVQTEPMAARALLEPLLGLLQADATEVDGQIVFRSRSRHVRARVIVPAVVDVRDEPLVETTRGQVSELANEAVLDHFDPAADFEPATARSRRLEAASRRQHRIALPATMDTGSAGREIDLWLRDHWSGRDRVSFGIPPTALAIEPGDVVTFDAESGEWLLVGAIADGIDRRVEARGLAYGVPSRVAPADPSRQDGLPIDALWKPTVALLDLPVMEGGDERAWARIAAFARPWRPASLHIAAGEDGYEDVAQVSAPSRMGTLTAPINAGVSGRFDNSAEIHCRFDFGAPASSSDLAVMNGANGLAIRSRSGGWEVVQFAKAEEVAIGQWRLSRLLRGQAGTEDAMAAGAEAGATVVLIDRAVTTITLPASAVAVPLNWRLQSRGHILSIADGLPMGLRALMPLSPVHLRARRQVNGDIVLSWIRRSRFYADSWMPSEIPLDAAQERYLIDIAIDGETVRSGEVPSGSLVYPLSEQIADAGAPVDFFRFTVRQFGDRVALGLPASRTIQL